MVRRLLVGKRARFDTRSAAVLHELHDVAGVAALKRVRLCRRYEIEGVAESLWHCAVTEVFADPAEDELLPEQVLEAASGRSHLSVAYVPGQFDQRADAAEQALALLGSVGTRVRVADLYLLEGALGAADMVAIESTLVNPVDSMVLSDEVPTTLSERIESAAPIPEVRDYLDPALRERVRAELTPAMSAEDAAVVAAYFEHNAGRAPTETELRLLDTYWSDHCRHTTFTTALKQVELPAAGPLSEPIRSTWEQVERARAELRRTGEPTLMELATIVMRVRRARGELPQVVFSDEVNACTVRVAARIGEQTVPYLVLFKNETHNHPTEIEPFGGAATCLGGAIRDPLSGRAYVYQAMRVTGAADPRTGVAQRLAGKLPQRVITRTAAAGYSSYGNQIGLATGIVDEYYHPGYVAKRLEVGAVVGAVPESQVRREQPVAGDVVLLIGGRTGRDGIGGASGSSRGHSRRSIERAGAEVQKGNPPTERALQRLFRSAEFASCVKRCNDFGAGGVAVAVGEIAAGIDINLDAVPLKYRGLTGTEIAISESQERMAVVVEPRDVPRVRAMAAAENLECTLIASVTDDHTMRMRWNATIVAEIGRDFLDSAGAPRSAAVRVATPRMDSAEAAELIAWHRWTFAEGAGSAAGAGNAAGTGGGADAEGGSIGPLPTAAHPSAEASAGLASIAALPTLLADLRFASRRGLGEWFDPSIGSRTLIAPYGGRTQYAPAEAMAALLPDPNARTATVMAHGFDPYLSAWSPYHGAYLAVVEALTRAVAAGARYDSITLSLQEYFPSPRQDPERWGLPTAALLGAVQAQLDLGVTAIGGKDSMSGSYEGLDVPPTLIAFALGTTESVTASHFDADEGPVFLVNAPLHDRLLPAAAELRAVLRGVDAAIASGTVFAARALRAGGVGIALAQMSFGETVGFETRFGTQELPPPFAAAYGAFVVQLKRGQREQDLIESGVPAAAITELGTVRRDGVLRYGDYAFEVAGLYRAWSQLLEEVFPLSEADERGVSDAAAPPDKTAAGGPKPAADSETTGRSLRRASVAHPLVVIPVFPGSNCEDDSRSAFEAAGAVVRTVVVRNATIEALEQSLAELAAALTRTQILMVPGGFSAGDEPGGSGKFIAAVLRAGRVREVIERHFVEGDNLILGICNGFQGLVRTGLVPFGRFTTRDEQSPTLAPNTVGRHIARTVWTRVAAAGGPWTTLVEPGTVVAEPISHGEGRFVWDERSVEDLVHRGQVSTQYVDYTGRLRHERPWNPNGSVAGVEGITSPDGRFLGKMAHSERLRPGLFRNLPEAPTLRLFESGVRFFA